MAGRRLTSIIVVALTVALAGSLLLPWVRSGAVDRSAWSLAGGARRLGVVDSALGEALLVVVFFVPALAFAAWIAAALDRPRFVSGFALAAAAITIVGALVVIRSSLDITYGVFIGTFTAVADCVAVIVLMTSRRRT